MIDSKELDNRFTHHPPRDADDVEIHVHIRRQAMAFAEQVNAHVPDGREKDLALARIEEAAMWANAGIARARGLEP